MTNILLKELGNTGTSEDYKRFTKRLNFLQFDEKYFH